MAAGRLSCLARNGRSPGEESRTAAVAAQAIEAQPSSGQVSQGEAVGRAPNSILWRSRGQSEGSHARGPACRAKRRRPWRRKRAASSQPNRSQSSAPHRLTVGRVGGRLEAVIEGCGLLSYRVGTSLHRPDLRQPVRRLATQRTSVPLVVQPLVSRRVSAPGALPVRRRDK